MNNNNKKGFIEFSEEELAKGVAHYLKPFIGEEVQSILSRKQEDESRPLTMAEACKWLGICRATFSKLVGKGEIKFTSLNPNTPELANIFKFKILGTGLRIIKQRALTILKMLYNECRL